MTFNAAGRTASFASKTVIIDAFYGDLPNVIRQTMCSCDGFRWKWEVGNETKEDHTLYAAWETSTATFDIGDGTRIEKQVKHNESIKLLREPSKDRLHFHWVEQEHQHNCSFAECQDRNGKGAFPPGVMVVIVVLTVIVVVALAVTVLVLSKRDREHMRHSTRNVELDKPLVGGDREEGKVHLLCQLWVLSLCSR